MELLANDHSFMILKLLLSTESSVFKKDDLITKYLKPIKSSQEKFEKLYDLASSQDSILSEPFSLCLMIAKTNFDSAQLPALCQSLYKDNNDKSDFIESNIFYKNISQENIEVFYNLAAQITDDKIFKELIDPNNIQTKDLLNEDFRKNAILNRQNAQADAIAATDVAPNVSPQKPVAKNFQFQAKQH